MPSPQGLTIQSWMRIITVSKIWAILGFVNKKGDGCSYFANAMGAGNECGNQLAGGVLGFRKKQKTTRLDH